MRLVRTFKTRVAGAALLTTVGALLAAFSLFLVRNWGEERDSLVQRRMTLASVMASNASAALVFSDLDKAQEVLVSSRRIPAVTGAALFDADGRLFAVTGEVSAVAEGAKSPTREFHGRKMNVHVPVRADHQRVGELVLASDMSPLYRTFYGYVLFAGIIFSAVTAAALTMANWLARRVIEPVDRLSAAMRTVRESGDFAQTVEPARDAELARLATEFNLLLAELARRNAELVNARDAADAANRLKTEFLANMSHELRTPLNGVLGMAQVLDAGALTPEQREHVGVISRSADDLLELLNDVLDVSRMEAGKLTLEQTVFDLDHVLDAACTPYRTLAEAKGLRFRVEREGAAGERLGDPMRLRQILTNLLSNALKFTDSGEIRVHAALAPGTPDLLQLRIEDTGIGIAADKLPLLFQKFSQADASTTRKYGGSGLGLAICHELARLMRGDIAVESRPGAGSTFSVSLPMPRPEAAAMASAEPRRPARILAAVEEPRMVAVLSALVELAGGDIRFVAESAALAEAVRGAPCDVVVVAGRAGAAEAGRLRAAEAAQNLARTPVLLLTEDGARSPHVDACLSRPIEAEAFLAAVDRLAGGDVAALAASA